MKVTLKIKGVDQLDRTLKRLGNNTHGDVLDAAVGTGAQPIVNRWKEQAPYCTGTYRRSIHHERGEVTKFRATRNIGTSIEDPPYPFFLEFGTSKMPPHPSMRPAWDAEISNAIKEIENALRKMLR